MFNDVEQNRFRCNFMFCMDRFPPSIPSHRRRKRKEKKECNLMTQTTIWRSPGAIIPLVAFYMTSCFHPNSHRLSIRFFFFFSFCHNSLMPFFSIAKPSSKSMNVCVCVSSTEIARISYLIVDFNTSIR